MPYFHNLYSSCSDDEEPPTYATAAPPTSPAATDEPTEPDVAPRTTRSSVKKVPQAQARNLKHAKKAKETDVSLEAYASMVFSDDVSNSSFLAFLSYTLTLTHFCSQALLKRFIALGTECAGYLKVAKASEGIILMSSHYFSSVLYLLLFIWLPFVFFCSCLSNSQCSNCVAGGRAQCFAKGL
jgi:hypothetical protein